MPERKSFWTTLPGILTGIAGIITAIAGLYLALVPDREKPIQPMEAISSEQASPREVEVPECDERINKAWEILQAHRGNLTDTVDDCLIFQETVLDIGCLQHSYTLDLGGKQDFERFTITVFNEWAYSPSADLTYHYKEFVTSLEFQGQIKNNAYKARRIKGSSDLWELLD